MNSPRSLVIPSLALLVVMLMPMRPFKQLNAGERTRVAAMFAFISGLYVLGLGLIATYAPGHAGLVGAAILAFTLGLRHAFDADHIAAIDNTTRKLASAIERPVGVGFYFSLGHATVVLVLTLLVAAVTHSIPAVKGFGGFLGAAISGGFLWIVGSLNLVVLLDVLHAARRMRTGSCDERELATMLVPRGMLTRLGLDRPMRFVSRSWQMFPVGLLFGLGFDTATEVALLTLGAGAAAAGLPLMATIALPTLFAAGMATMDTLDGVLMSHAYDWALRRPARKLFYNLTITALSVTVALAVGTIELANVAIGAFDLQGSFWSTVAGLDLQVIGYVLAGLFLATWLIALLLWHLLDIERRWTPAVTNVTATTSSMRPQRPSA
jgi:high-affinity nickel-transport protein